MTDGSQEGSREQTESDSRTSGFGVDGTGEKKCISEEFEYFNLDSESCEGHHWRALNCYARLLSDQPSLLPG